MKALSNRDFQTQSKSSLGVKAPVRGHSKHLRPPALIREYRDERRCPCCNRLLFKTSGGHHRTDRYLHCLQCKLGGDYENCRRLYCRSWDDGRPCPECKRGIDCTECDRFYYRAWLIERYRAIEIKCPKCRNIIVVNRA